MSEPGANRRVLIFYLLVTLSALCYYFICYQTKRENFQQVLALYSCLFGSYFFLNKYFSTTHFKHLLIAGFVFRMLLILSVPNLSDDVYRFIWDGRLAANGINPFSHLPAEIIQMPLVTGITKDLYHLLNSRGYYTIYPPVLQGIFWLAAKVFPVNVIASIVFLKTIIITVEFGTVFILMKLLQKLSLPKQLSLLYILNPLVITELTGNVHFEGIMIFFVLSAFLLFLNNSWKLSAVFIGLGIATKLIPVLFIPLFIQKLGWRKGLIFGFISAVVSLVLFAWMFDLNTLQHLVKSVDLFFQKFEFNASIYYLVRWIGRWITGYNIIASAGPFLSLTAILIILFISFFNNKKTPQQFFIKALYIVTTWFLFSTTVHPWYICLPVALAVFTNYRYALLWSYTAILSYAAYSSNPVHENLLLVGIGYLAMAIYALWEWKFERRTSI